MLGPVGRDRGGAGDLGERALQEAVELLKEAQALAEQQARAELMQGWAADGGGSGGDDPTPGDTPAGPEAVAAFLSEQGLSAREAERLAEGICSSDAASASAGGGGGGGGGAGPPSLSRLQAKWEGLRRVLPDADLGAMLAAEPALLRAAAADLVGVMVALVEAFPEADVQGMAQGRPALLLMPAQDLRRRCERVVSKLLQLHPSKDRGVVSEVIAENPELLIRMDHYMDALLLDELPIELQNMFIPPGDMGIGWLYRHYGSSRGKGGG